MSTRALPKWVPILAPILAAVVYTLILKTGHDFAQYIVQVPNIAQGCPL